MATDRGLQLQAAPFDEFATELTDRRRYTATQALGTAMRGFGIEAFEYRSARDPAGGINVALFTPVALASRSPSILEEWLCDTDATHVSYYSRHGGGIQEFPLATFTVDGVLPTPADCSRRMTSIDTIAAISTAPGRGGIGVVRVSGPATRAIARADARPCATTTARGTAQLHG